MNIKQATTILRTFDETKTREFYVDYLGFKVDWEHRFEEGMPLYVQVSKDECVLHLSEHHGDGTPGTIIRIECDDVTSYHKELTSKNYRSLNPGSIIHPGQSRNCVLLTLLGINWYSSSHYNRKYD